MASNEIDLELGPKPSKPPQGFALVASKLSTDTDKTTTIYRRFDILSSRNLLFYQAELSELEDQQKTYDEEDLKARSSTSIECLRDWNAFAQTTLENGEERKRQREKMELAMKIREVLEKYHAALASHKLLLNSPPPSRSTVTALRNWFLNGTSSYSPNKPPTPRLWGASKTILDDPHDLVALRVPADQDRLSQFIENNFGVFFQTGPAEGRSTYVSERAIARFVAVFSTILAAVLLFGAIISLYVVQNQYALLGMLSGWTILFAACVGLLTNAKRDQIFGATAAYAAVLVVFVSGNLGGSPTNTGTCV